MKRDWHTIEVILTHVEAGDLASYNTQRGYLRDGVTEGDFIGHLEILNGAGILRGCTVQRDVRGQYCFCDVSHAFITMQGHDLLDAIRNQTVWGRIKTKAERSGAPLSWEFIKAAIPEVMKELVASV